MKFRTLKDIRKQVYSQCKDEAEKRLLEHLFRLEDEEAIKWVKDIRNSVPSTSQKKEDIRCYSESFIKHFFNITEEDLKSEEKK